MNICIVYMSAYPWDVRVEKIATFLAQSGHQVHILCRTTKGRQRIEKIDNISITRLQLFSDKLYKLNRFFDLPYPFNPFWIKHISNFTRRANIDLIIVRDIPLAIPSIIAARKNHIPVILDMAEHYAAMFSDFIKDSPLTKKIPRFIMKNPMIATLTENIVIRYIDHIFTVVEESKWRLENLGVPVDKISIISNTPHLSKKPTDKFDVPNGLKLVYIGQLQHTRGIGTVIEGLHLAIKTNPDIHLYIAGSGEQKDYFVNLIGKHNLENNIHYLGWVKPIDAYAWINSCDVGIVPPLSTKHIISTIPNKLFDYMLCSQPVLVSDVAPLKRIISETNCGWSFKAGNPNDFANKVLEIAQMQDIGKFGANGREAIIRKYNWEYDSNILLENINRITSNPQ